MRSSSPFIQAIKIDVKKTEPTHMRIHQRKRWAGYFFRVDVESSGEALYENSFAGAQGSVKQENFAAAELGANLLAESKSFSGVGRLKFTGCDLADRIHDWKSTGTNASSWGIHLWIERPDSLADVFANIGSDHRPHT